VVQEFHIFPSPETKCHLGHLASELQSCKGLVKCNVEFYKFLCITYTAINIDNLSWRTRWPWRSCHTTRITLKMNIEIIIIYLLPIDPQTICSVKLDMTVEHLCCWEMRKAAIEILHIALKRVLKSLLF